MRFTNTLLLALSAVAVHSAVINQDNNANGNNQQTETQPQTQAQNTQANTNTQNDNKKLTPEAQCVINSNCNEDVACIARCYGVPAPTKDMVYQTNDCASKCPDSTVDSAVFKLYILLF
ncbi:hypothetical protein U3516DRAFT_825934 [Neocallimastix sp. 'constans']